MSERPGLAERIKLGFVIDTLLVRKGGTEGQLLYLLERIDRDRFEPCLYCLQSSDWLEQEFDLAPWRNLELKVSIHPLLPAMIWNFSRVLRQDGIQLLQTHLRDGNIVGVTAGWLAGTEVIISTRRGVPYWSTNAGLWFLKLLNRKVSFFVSNSSATQNWHAEAEGIPKSSFEVINNGLDPERFRVDRQRARAALREELALPPDTLIVIQVSNVRRLKGIQEFLDAASSLTARLPGVHFVVAGGGDVASLRAAAHAKGLCESVTFLGTRQDVPKLLGAADVGVLASHFESFSNAVLEYLAAGLPVVVTDVGGAREVVRPGENGFIVPPQDPSRLADRLEFLLRQPGGPRNWVNSGGLDPRFHVDAMVRAHERLYFRLVEASGPTTRRTTADSA